MVKKKGAMPRSDEEWKTRLNPEQYRVLRRRGTELPFTGKLLFNKARGVYSCVGCGAPVFSSDAKFDSPDGWPSFYEPLNKGAVKYNETSIFGIKCFQVACAKCGGHLGHVFDDGPLPTGKRYCINSCALGFEKK